MKILILKFRNIGDVLLVNPLLENLKMHYPEASIDIAVNKGTESMVQGHFAVNKIIIYDRERVKKHSLFIRLFEELRFAWKLRAQHYDIVINLTSGDRGAQLSLISGAPIRIGYRSKNKMLSHVFTHILPSQGMRHTLLGNLDPLTALKLPILSYKVSMPFTHHDMMATPSYSDFIHIHPVSRWLFKCIEDSLMAEIIDFCQNELNKTVVLTASPDVEELKKIDTILSHCKTTPISLAGQLTLKQTAALSSKSSLFIGVDTAIMHIAAANNIPVLAFFGPSGAFHWGPWDNDAPLEAYANRNGIQRMGKHRVIQVDWTCAPCGEDGCNGSKISNCLLKKGLEIDTIKHHIKEMLHD